MCIHAIIIPFSKPTLYNLQCDYGITEDELSASEDETESDFENFVFPLLSGEKYSCDEKTFLVYESSLTELLASCARCGSRINNNLIEEIKNTGSQLTLRIACVKGNFKFSFEGTFLRVGLLPHNDDFVFKQS